MRRALYRPLGEGNAPTVDAISLRAGAIGDGWLPQTAGAMAFELQKAPSREGEQSGKQTRRLPYSRASFERVPHELGALCASSPGQHRGRNREQPRDPS
ncbi:MAG: hypothetical protein IPM29_11610 [Planctomycetes bacterium]|nr:hypothetical protein [Planctomycetota bacterium]